MTRRRPLPWIAGCGCLSAAVLAVPLFVLVLIALVPVGLRVGAWQREASPADEIAPAAGRFVEADGLRIYLQEHGPADGAPVLLIHGTSAWSGTWRDTQAELADAGLRVIALDLPPFGFSDRPDPAGYDRGAQARRILAVADALQLDRFALVGHSFGGGPTVEVALTEPDRVWALVLVAAALSLDSVDAEPGPAATIAEIGWLRELLVASTFTNPLLTRTGLTALIHDPADASPDRIALYQAFFDVTGTTSAIGAWLPELMAPDPSARSLDPSAYQVLQLPALVVWGTEDTATPPAQGERLHGLLPRSELVWLDDVGHIPQIEDVPAFHAAVRPFLLRHVPP